MTMKEFIDLKKFSIIRCIDDNSLYITGEHISESDCLIAIFIYERNEKKRV